ncbi:hypothetical protein VP142E351_P0050 [Vibrio phage 142E35-1]|nr:hypothetical protein VP142E351_P0050 [Vibrio phage 142E35-1]
MMKMSEGFSLPVNCVFDEDGVPFQIDDSHGDLLIDGEQTCYETNFELVAHAINNHDRLVNLETDRKNAISKMSKSWQHNADDNDDLLTRFVEMVNRQFEERDRLREALTCLHRQITVRADERHILETDEVEWVSKLLNGETK